MEITTNAYTGELKTSESTCSIDLLADAPPVAIMRVFGPVNNYYIKFNCRYIRII